MKVMLTLKCSNCGSRLYSSTVKATEVDEIIKRISTERMKCRVCGKLVNPIIKIE